MSEWENKDFNEYTVLELRKVAKAMGVMLGAGISKAGIVEKLNRARDAKKADTAAQPAAVKASSESPAKPVAPSHAPAMPTTQSEPVTPAEPDTSAESVASVAPAAPITPAEPITPVEPVASAAQLSEQTASRPIHGNYRPAYQAPTTPPRFSTKPAYQASSSSTFGSRPTRPPMQQNDYPRPVTRPASYTPRFGPPPQQDSQRADDSYYASSSTDYSRPASTWNDRRPTYATPQSDRRPAAYNDSRSQRSYDAPASYGAPQMRQSSYGAQRDMTSDYRPMNQQNDMLAPADCQDGCGYLDLHPDGYGFLRGISLLPSNRDIYVSMAQVRRFSLRTGDFVSGKVRPQRDGDKYSAMLYITEVNGCVSDSIADRPSFDDLTPCYPHMPIIMESEGTGNNLDMRLISLIAPIGFGQRSLIQCPPAADRARLLTSIDNAISICHPDAEVMTLLLGGTPEDATCFRDHAHGHVIASTFDMTPENHLRIVDLTLERAERLVEMKKDVVLLVDNLMYLSKIYTTAAVQQGRQSIGMVNPASLQKAKRLFGAARCTREGGTLTVIAVMNTETGNRVDDSIIEDFKGTANMELVLDQATARAGIYPPINLTLSGTKRAELIATQEHLNGIQLIHDMLGSLRSIDMIPQLQSMLEKTTNNSELLLRIKDWASLMKK